MPRDTKGIAIIDDWNGFGQRVTGSGTTMLDNVEVHPLAVLFLSPRCSRRPTSMGPFAQIMHAAIEAGIARGALADTIDFVRTRSRPWKDAGVDRADQDPYTIAEVGEMQISVARLGRAAGRAPAKFVDAAAEEPSASRRSPRRRSRSPKSKAASTEAALLRLQQADRARGVARDAAGIRVGSPLAQRAHPLGARSRAMEISRRRRLLAERRQSAASRRDLNPMTRQIHFNAFDMNCVGHQSPGLWAHPRDRSWQYKDLEYWTELAKMLERGKFDGIFIADVLGVYDVFRGDLDTALRVSAQIPGQRSAAARARDGAGHRASRLRRHRLDLVRTSLHIRAPHLDARPSDQRPRRLEHRHLLSRERRAQHRSRAARRSTTIATTSPTNIWRSSTSSGKAAGRTARCCATGSAAFSPIPRKCGRSAMKENISRSRACISASRRRSERRFSTRPAPRAGGSASPANMPNACSSRRRRRRC